MNNEPYYVTKEALEKLKDQLRHLKTVKRGEIVERIHNAIKLGDLSENAEYSDAKEEQGFVEGKILELENMVRNAKIIEEGMAKGTIHIGSTFTAECGNLGQKEFTIVGSNEAAPAQGKISNESPIGKSFLGRKLNEEVEYTTPKGVMKCKIINIK